jgi:GINS complex subunit 2
MRSYRTDADKHCRAADDIPDSDLVRSLLKDLREARQAKVLQGLNSVNPFHLEVSYLRLLAAPDSSHFLPADDEHLALRDCRAAALLHPRLQ